MVFGHDGNGSGQPATAVMPIGIGWLSPICQASAPRSVRTIVGPRSRHFAGSRSRHTPADSVMWVSQSITQSTTRLVESAVPA